MKARLGHITAVQNKDRAFGSAPVYEPVWLVRDGKTLPFAFTKDQLDDAHRRALANQEDMPQLKKCWFNR